MQSSKLFKELREHTIIMVGAVRMLKADSKLTVPHKRNEQNFQTTGIHR